MNPLNLQDYRIQKYKEPNLCAVLTAIQRLSFLVSYEIIQISTIKPMNIHFRLINSYETWTSFSLYPCPLSTCPWKLTVKKQTTYYMIPFIWSIRNKHIYRVQSTVVAAQGWEGFGGWWRYGDFFLRWQTVLKLTVLIVVQLWINQREKTKNSI